MTIFDRAPDMSCHAIFSEVERQRRLACDQQIAEINRAFDRLKQHNDLRAASRAAELLRSFRGHTLHRAAAIGGGLSTIDQKKRTVELTFASEYPVFRRSLNAYEVLSMSPKAANLMRLNGGGALLSEHNRADQIGGVMKAWIGADKRARAVVKFSQSKRGQEFFQDVLDGLRRNVSFHYLIYDGTVKAGTRGALDTFYATSWEATEISFVSVPADPTIGVGRKK